MAGKMGVQLSDRQVLWTVEIWVYVRFCRHIIRFRRKVGYWPSVSMPRRYHEKMLWRRLFDRNPLFTTLCDKLAVKEWTEKVSGLVSAPKTHWSGRDTAELAAFARSKPMFLKSNHGWRQNLKIGADDVIDSSLQHRASKWLKRPWGKRTHQWGYWSVPRRLFLEEVIGTDCDSVIDFSVHAASGQPVVLEVVASDGALTRQKGYFHTDGHRWRELEPADRQPGVELLREDRQIPEGWKEALASAKRLSDHIDYARFDFLLSDGRAYQGEVTVYPGAGLNSERLFRNYSAEVGAAWNLKNAWFVKTPQEGIREVYRKALVRSL